MDELGARGMMKMDWNGNVLIRPTDAIVCFRSFKVKETSRKEKGDLYEKSTPQATYTVIMHKTIFFRERGEGGSN